MGGGKGGGSTTTTVEMTPEQKEQIALQNKFFKETIAPTYEGAVRGATDIYNKNAPGVLNAAQNQARTAMQAQESLGGTGESALRSGISGLQSLFNPDYEKTQIQAALAPAQAQYAQNVAAQQAQFGGTGNLGSARQALADRQLAGATQSAQMQAAAGVMRDLNQQKLQAAQGLTGAGGNYLQAGLGAKSTQLGAAERPMDWMSQKGKMLGLTPSQLYTPQYPGQQGTTETKNPGLKDIIGLFA